MTSGHASAGKRTWPATFLSLVRENFSDYKINREVKGRFTELYRDVGNLLHLQSTIKHHDQYSHCFAVSATSLKSAYLTSPFWAGGRLDHNYTIQRAFAVDLAIPATGPNSLAGLHSTHALRKGFEEIVRRCTANAEKHLAGHYRKILATATPILLRCIELIDADPEILANTDRQDRSSTTMSTWTSARKTSPVLLPRGRCRTTN